MKGVHFSPATEFKKGCRINLGRKRTQEQIRNHPRYKGGISKTPEYIKMCRQQRKALMRNGSKLSIKRIQMVYEDNIKKYGTLTCIYCLKSIEFGKDTLEHKIPIIRGGTNDYENLAVACFSCNSSKGRKTVEEYMEYRRKKKIGRYI